MGLGASSYIQGFRFHNESDLSLYDKIQMTGTDADEKLHQEITKLSDKEKMEEFMFLGLRMRDGFYRDEFTQAFGIPIEAVYGDALNHLQQEELLLKREGRIYLTDKGMDLNNYVVAQFML